MTVNSVGQKVDEQFDVLFKRNALADLHQMFFPHAAVFRIVQDQVSQLSTLLYQIDARQAGDLLVESGSAEQLA